MITTIKKILFVLVFCLSVIVMTGCNDKDKVTKITLDKENLTLTVGEKKTVTATLTPSSATDKVTWKSSDENVAKVKNGEIEAISKGSAIITASVGDVKAVVNVTVVKVKRTVTFNTNGGSAVSPMEVEDNELLSNITTPTKTNNEFVGWFTDVALTMAFDQTKPITGDVTLYAKWKITKVVVTFNTNGGSAVASVELTPGAKVTKPTNPTKEYHSFGGWYADSELTSAYNFNLSVNNDLTLYAKWNPVKYSISFETNEGSPIASVSVSSNSKLTQPTNPTKEGYKFGGWFKDAALTEEYDFNTLVYSSFTLYAKWEANEVDYKVRHLTYNSTTNQFDLAEEKTFKALVGSEVTVYPNEYPGLMSEEVEYKAIVLSDGSLVIEIKYITPIITFNLVLNGGNFTYQTRAEVVADFLADYNLFSNTAYTIETLPTGAWSPVNFSTMLYDARFRTKWLWLADYLGQVGSNANKSGCVNIVSKSTEADFNKVSDDKYRVSYEVRGFILGIKFASNGNFISSDYSDYNLANGFWDTFARYNEQLKYENLPEPYTLPTVAYKEGFDFGGWYSNPEFKGEPITVVDRKYTLYAKWNEKNPVTEVIITNKVATMEKLSTHQLIVNVLPENAFNKSIYFITSDDKIVKVSDTGIVSAINAGKATITVMSVNGVVSDTFEVTVYPTDNLDVKFSEGYNGTLEVSKEASIITIGEGTFKNVELEFASTNASVLTVDSTGKFSAIAKGTADIEIKVKNGDVIITITVTVIEPTTATRIDQLLNLLVEGNVGVVDYLNVSLLYDTSSAKQQYYKSTYGSVNYFLFDGLNLDSTTYIIDPTNSTKSSGLKSSTEFIIVHDTANISGGLTNHGSYWKDNGHTSSIHFTVGDYGVVQSLDTRYAAHHAGDGTSTKFNWLETGVNAIGNAKPVIDINSNGNFTINGVETPVKAPTDGSGKILDKSYFTDLGPTWTIIDGKYFLGTHRFDTSQTSRGVIGSRGGNLNSTGIEMCVNKNGDIYDTWQRTAKLVGQLMIEHSLDINKVIMHNTITGKNCPQSLREAKYWDTFIKMVEIEHEIKSNYSDATITMVSNNPTLVSNTGRVIGRPNTTQAVTYDITVTIGAETRTIKLGSVIPGISTWDQFDGYFPIK